RHRLLDVLLGGNQLASDRPPIAFFPQFGKAGAVAHDAVAHAQTARLTKQNAAEVFDQISFLRFDDQEAVSHEAAENHSHLFPAGVRRLGKLALQLLVGQRLEIIELLENFGDRRSGIRVDPQLLALVLARFLREQHNAASIYNKSSGYSDNGFHSQTDSAREGLPLAWLDPSAQTRRNRRVVPPKNVSALRGQTPDF